MFPWRKLAPLTALMTLWPEVSLAQEAKTPPAGERRDSFLSGMERAREAYRQANRWRLQCAVDSITDKERLTLR